MANIPTKVSIKSATEHYNDFDLSHDHYNTTDFFKIQPVLIHELVPKSKIDVKASLMSRLMPLFKPMYAGVEFKLRGFFVPLRVLMANFNDYYQDTPTTGVVASTVPYLTNKQLYDLFKISTYSTTIGASGVADFFIQDTGTIGRYFTPAGQYAYSVLNGLGYQINFNDNDTTSMSALPLFAMCKIIQDWLTPAAYVNVEIQSIIDQYANGGNVTDTHVAQLIGYISRKYYKKDYFTQSWDSPTAPNSHNNSKYTIPDITSTSVANAFGNNINNNSSDYDAPFIDSRNTSNGQFSVSRFTQYSVDALKSLSDFLKRKQLSGSRTLDRFIAQYGVKLSSEKLKRSVYCGSHDCNIQVADIMSTTDNDNVSLGDYAGRGVASMSNKPFAYSSDEFGYFIIISTVVPRTPICNGRKRFIFHGVDNRLSFYQPEFDQLGTQAVRKDEVYGNYHSGAVSLPFSPDGIFGFTPRYSEYKVATGDDMSGDFNLQSMQGGLDVFHLARMFHNRESQIVHNENFVKVNDDQVNRIWQASVGDHFVNIYHFDVKASMPMSKLYDNYHFEEEGKDTVINVGGTQLTD